MKTWKRIWKTGAMAFSAVFLLSACAISEAIVSGSGVEREYGKAEIMVVLSTEKTRYEELYTEEIWTAVVDQKGTTFETILLSQVHDFLYELKLMNHMAEEQEIALTSRERELVKEASASYYEKLGAAHADVFGLEKQDLEAFYQDYWIAEKLVEQLTGGMNLEVSDSEAKVIEVLQIELEDRMTAEEVLAQVQAENADFSSIAKDYSEQGAVNVSLHYGMMGETYENAAYGLANDEISGIIAEDVKYYILKCTDDYDEEATKIRKEEIVQQKKNEAFHSSYQTYKADKVLEEDAELWESLSMDIIPDTDADFFAIFEEICLEQNAE